MAVPSEWDAYYKAGVVPWRSAGLSRIARTQIGRFAGGKRVLEVGCGFGDDAEDLVAGGFDYSGLDISREAVGEARRRFEGRTGADFVCANFFEWRTDVRFDLIYEKGFVHGLEGEGPRQAFFRRASRFLKPCGIVVVVAGARDSRNPDRVHGAVFLQDIVVASERYLEIVNVEKGSYGLRETWDFGAWYVVLRSRKPSP